MAEAAKEAGLEYIAITDHSQALAMANGLDERRALEHAARVRSADGIHGVRLLAGIECDIRPDGTLDLSDDLPLRPRPGRGLGALGLQSGPGADDRSAASRDRQPNVDIIGHPTGRRILKREPYLLDIEAIADAAARTRCRVGDQLSGGSARSERCHARLARDRGAPIVISSDAHSRAAFGALRWGTVVARRAWLEPAHVWNTRPFDAFTASLRRRRR
jgi:DNA polymerase (family 10)